MTEETKQDSGSQGMQNAGQGGSSSGTGVNNQTQTNSQPASAGAGATLGTGQGDQAVAGVTGMQLGHQQAGQVYANPGMHMPKPLGSSKPPKFDDTFEVYQMRLKLYLEQRDSWGVVIGADTHHETDPILQRQFDDRNRLAMETIIRGAKGADAQKICNFETAREMWETLTAEKTQRDFSYAVHLKRELYTHSYTPGQKMSNYIQEMNSLRQRLQHMGPSFEIQDSEMSQL